MYNHYSYTAIAMTVTVTMAPDRGPAPQDPVFHGFTVFLRLFWVDRGARTPGPVDELLLVSY